MNKIYVYDACALIAVIEDEPGASIVDAAYQEASEGRARLIMNKVNLLEVYYGILREQGNEYADKILDSVERSIIEITDISYDVLKEAGRIKANYKTSLADSVAIAETTVADAFLLTADHHEMDAVERGEARVKFCWIR